MMKKLVFSLAVLVLSLSFTNCVPQESPIRIVGTYRVPNALNSGACDLTIGVQQGGGSLNIGWRSSYLMTISVDSELTTTSALGVSADRNNFIIDEIDYSYKSSVPIAGLNSEILPVHLVVPPGSAADPFLVNMLGTGAVDALRGSISEDGSIVQVIVALQLKGYLASANGSSRLSSNTLYYPIKIFSTGLLAAPSVTCGLPKAINPMTAVTDNRSYYAPTGPCLGMPGQDDGIPSSTFNVTTDAPALISSICCFFDKNAQSGSACPKSQ